MPRKASKQTHDQTAEKPLTKSAFVRSFSSLKPAEIVEKGQEAGLKFSVEYVYSIRRNAKKAGATKGRSAPRGTAAAPERKPSKRAPHGHGAQRGAMKALVLHHGIEGANRLLAEVVADLLK